MTAPLIVTRDETLLDDLLRLSAAAGVVPDVAAEAGQGLRGWSTASTILVGVDAAADLVQLRATRRRGVHIVGWGHLPDDVFRTAVALGAENVAELPRSDEWVLEVLADAGESTRAEGLLVGVVGGSGGSGATTFACALAAAAAELGPACLVDADPLGPGVDRVLGLEQLHGARWEALQQTTGRISARALRESLPRRQNLGVLTFGPGSAEALQAFAVREALAAAVRGHDTVVLDLPRSGDALTSELAGRCRHVLVTALTTLPGLTSASRVVEVLGASTPVSVVLRGTGVEPREAARLLGAPVVASMGSQRGLDESVALGYGPVRNRRSVLARAVGTTLDLLRPDAA